MPFRKAKSFTAKPEVGAIVNWAHPLAQGLLRCWIFNEKGGLMMKDLARNDLAIEGRINADTKFTITPKGPVFKQGADGGGSPNSGVCQKLLGLGASGVSVASSFLIGGANPDLEPVFGASGGTIFSTRTLSTDVSPTFAHYPGGASRKLVFGADSSGLFVGAQSSTSLATDTWYRGVGTYNRDTSNATYGGTWQIYLNGLPDGATNNINLAGSFNGVFTDTVPGLFKAPNDTFTSDGTYEYIYVWNRALTYTEVRELDKNPYCFLMPSKRRTISATGAVAAATYRLKALLGVGL